MRRHDTVMVVFRKIVLPWNSGSEYTEPVDLYWGCTSAVPPQAEEVGNAHREA